MALVELEQIKHKALERRKIIKLKSKSGTSNRKTKEKLNETQSSFFENIKKGDKLLARLNRKKKDIDYQHKHHCHPNTLSKI